MNMLVRKIQSLVPLGDRDRRALVALSGDVRAYGSGEDLIQAGARPDCVFIVTQGWAGRYKLLPDGRRQIAACMLPGDTSDLFSFAIERMDHSIGALGPCMAAAVPQAEIMGVVARHPAVARALYRTMLVDGATSREWLLNIGQRDGYSRLAHLFCELRLRMRAVGLNSGNSFTLPCTQIDLADTMGLTPVYINRTLQRMRGDGLITLRQRELTILDPARLAEISGFNPDYLHLRGSFIEPAEAVVSSIKGAQN